MLINFFRPTVYLPNHILRGSNHVIKIGSVGNGIDYIRGDISNFISLIVPSCRLVKKIINIQHSTEEDKCIY